MYTPRSFPDSREIEYNGLLIAYGLSDSCNEILLDGYWNGQASEQ